MRRHYPVEILHDKSNLVFIPEELQEKASLKKIAFGNHSSEADIHLQPSGKNIISLSSDLAQTLKFPDIKGPLHLFSDHDTLYLGPLVGIFTSGFTPFHIRPIGERSLFFGKLLSVSKSVGTLSFVFGEQHINWEKGTINGLFYQDNGWKSVEIPFPNVIYDRLPNRKSERQSVLKTAKERLQADYLIPWYNPGFFNKLDVYERLLQNDEAEKYLPETHSFVSFSEIERMLSDYGHVFIKPIHGSLGLGIHQIIYDKTDEYYYCRYRSTAGHNKLTRYKSLEALMKHVFNGRNLSRMIVQQGIHLHRYDQRTVDFRVHTNKNDAGKWVVTAMAAKVAGPGSVTTHINNGGAIKTIEEIFPVADDQTQAVHALTSAALELSEALDQNMEGIIGEIGFDLGLDRRGKVWLFEANSKPGRSIFKHPKMKEFDLLTRKFSLAFSVFLTERVITKPEELFL